MPPSTPMSSLVSALLFPVPTPSYSANSFPYELLWIPRSLDYKNSEKGTCVPAVFLKCPNARYTVIYLHSNGEDVGLAHAFASGLRRILEVHVLLIEYPGYGICPGEPSEDTLRSTAELSFCFATEVLAIPGEDIIVMGRSLGAALAVGLAQRFSCHGLVLIAPFLSLVDAVGQYMGQDLAQFLVDDIFCNRRQMGAVQVQTLVIHGEDDKLIAFTHGQQLCELCASENKLFVCPRGMGHNVDLLSDAEFLIRPMLSFFALPDYSFEELRVPHEAFNKRLCPLYHGLVELTKHDRPLSKPMGDDEAPGESITRGLDRSAPAYVQGQLFRSGRESKTLGPQAEFQCPKSEGDLGERVLSFSSAGLSPTAGAASAEEQVPGLLVLDLDTGISRFLSESAPEVKCAPLGDAAGQGANDALLPPKVHEANVPAAAG